MRLSHGNRAARTETRTRPASSPGRRPAWTGVPHSVGYAPRERKYPWPRTVCRPAAPCRWLERAHLHERAVLGSRARIRARQALIKSPHRFSQIREAFTIRQRICEQADDGERFGLEVVEVARLNQHAALLEEGESPGFFGRVRGSRIVAFQPPSTRKARRRRREVSGAAAASACGNPLPIRAISRRACCTGAEAERNVSAMSSSRLQASPATTPAATIQPSFICGRPMISTIRPARTWEPDPGAPASCAATSQRHTRRTPRPRSSIGMLAD